MGSQYAGAAFHADQFPEIPVRRVFYTGSDIVNQGYGLCYVKDGGTATAASPTRYWNVALPSQTNNLAFAGVARTTYAAKSGGQWIEIFEPGALQQIYVDGSVTIGESVFATCQIGGVGTGTFNTTNPGFMGRGTARICQTRTGAGLVYAELMDGPESGLVETLTLTAGGAFTAMISGLTLFAAATIASGATFTLADGTFQGEKKAFIQTGTTVTSTIAITVTHGQQDAVTTALASLTFAAGAGVKFAYLEWTGTVWKLIAATVTSPARA